MSVNGMPLLALLFNSILFETWYVPLSEHSNNSMEDSKDFETKGILTTQGL